MLIYHGGRDGPNYLLLLQLLREGRVNKVAFVKPAGASWLLPLHDLVLLTAAEGVAHERSGVVLSLITPEEEPLGIFGKTASAAIRRLLDESGVTLHTSSYGTPGRPGWLDITPGDRGMSVDRIVTVPRLVGPRLRGIAATTLHRHRRSWPACRTGQRVRSRRRDTLPGQAGRPGRPAGRRRRRGDAASVGVDIDPQPFRPILRELLLTGGPPRYLQSDISGRAGDAARRLPMG